MAETSVAVEVLPGSVWQHVKSGRVYFVVGIIPDCTNARDGQRLVHYIEEGDRRDADGYARELSEFADGRFVEIDVGPPAQFLAIWRRCAAEALLGEAHRGS